MKTKRPTLAVACARYINRYTVDYVPAWTRTPCEGNGKFYAPQFASDSEWYENTKFPGEPGHHGMGDDCYTSGQTWPLGNWLDAPFVEGQAKPTAIRPGAKHAYVTGRKGTGYTIVISPEAFAADFDQLGQINWGTYRAAQSIANAVNAHMAAKEGK